MPNFGVLAPLCRERRLAIPNRQSLEFRTVERSSLTLRLNIKSISKFLGCALGENIVLAQPEGFLKNSKKF